MKFNDEQAITNIIWKHSHAYNIKILQDVRGIINPSRLLIFCCQRVNTLTTKRLTRKNFFGRMTLLLGHPGCGKTTLLLALAGKLDQNLKVIPSSFISSCEKRGRKRHPTFQSWDKIYKTVEHCNLQICHTQKNKKGRKKNIKTCVFILKIKLTCIIITLSFFLHKAILHRPKERKKECRVVLNEPDDVAYHIFKKQWNQTFRSISKQPLTHH